MPQSSHASSICSSHAHPLCPPQSTSPLCYSPDLTPTSHCLVQPANVRSQLKGNWLQQMIPYSYSRSSFSAVHSCKINHFYYLIASVFLAYNLLAYIADIISPISIDSKSLTGACPCLFSPTKETFKYLLN